MAKTGVPIKLDEVIEATGKTRRETALELREVGLRMADIAGGCEVDRETLRNWCKADPAFSAAFARAKSDGIGVRIKAAADGSRESVALLGRLYGYTEGRPDVDWDA